MISLLPGTGVARRLASINMVASGTALALACLTLMAYDFITFRSTMLRNRTIQAQIVGSNTVTALTFDDPAAAQRTLAALSAAPHIEATGLYRPDGTLFAAYYRDVAVEPLVLADIPAEVDDWHAYQGLQRMHVVQRVEIDGTGIGIVYIRSDLEEVTARLTGYGLIVSGTLLMSIIASQIIGRVATRSISRPITELAVFATRLSSERDYSVRTTLTAEGELGVLITNFNEMVSQIQQRDQSLIESRDSLEKHVLERTEALNASNQELEAFCYSVSHDLRSPLRSIDGFSLALLEDLEGTLDEGSMDHLRRIRAATQRMGTLIDDLLNLSRISRTELTMKHVDVSAVVRGIIDDHRVSQRDRQVEIVIADGLSATGDPRLIRQVLENLVGNAWKFTSKRADARIQFGAAERDGELVYFVSDNGAGFDPAFADRLFGVFQRLHGMTEFPGTGVGLAIVDRIVRRHNGRIWADAAVGRGATFFFTLAPPASKMSKAA